MAEEQLPIYIVILGTTLILLLGFFMGRLLDVNWRCNIMRRFTRKNYVVLNITDKEGRTIKSTVVDATDDTATVGTDMWVITKGKIYNKRTPGISVLLGERDVRYESGSPNIYVNRESITALSFHPMSGETIKPTEIGATLQAWIANQKAKMMASINKMNILLYIILALLVGNLVFSWINSNAIGAVKTEVSAVKSALVPSVTGGTGTVENGKLVIDQTKQATGG